MSAELDRVSAAVADLETQVDLAIALIVEGDSSDTAALPAIAERLEAKAAAIRAALSAV